jgi:peptidyl-tRNA hydrolase, PTH1 family
VGEGFPRLRLGIRGESRWHDLAEYVLERFDADEEPVVNEMVERACDCVTAVLYEGIGRAASRFNTAITPPAEG